MESLVTEYVLDLPMLGLLAVIAVCLYLLSKGADLLVTEAVTLSIRLGVSKVLIGATIVSLGTTLPEVSVSVMAALKGNPDLALGNAVGSIICDTGLILGLAALIGKVPLERKLVNRQGYVQLGSAALLVVACLPFSRMGSVFDAGGGLPQAMGFVFLGLLAGYLWLSARWARDTSIAPPVEGHVGETAWKILLKIALGLALVVLSSEVLIPTVEETAVRLSIPHAVIAATLVAFGTSLPELVTAITAVRKGHGELAVGNVIGADILNALFVAGASAAVTPGGLAAGPKFFTTLFPAMLGILLLFRISVALSGNVLGRKSGAGLLGAYLAYLWISF